MSEEIQNNDTIEEVPDIMSLGDLSADDFSHEPIDVTIDEETNEERVGEGEEEAEFVDEHDTEESTEEGDETEANEEEVDYDEYDTEDGEEEEVDEQTYEDDVEYYTELSEATGYEINDSESIVNAFAELDELRSANENKYADLPNELQMAIDIHNNGGDYNTALQQASMDYEDMDSKEVLKQSYLNENIDLVKSDKDFAEMKFEKDYDAKYGVLEEYNAITDEDDKADFYEENQREIDFAQASHKHDVNNAREAMSSFKQNATSVQGNANGPSEEQINEWIQEHDTNVANTVSEYGGIELSFGDNAEDNFALALGDDEMELMQETLSQPQEFLKEVLGLELTDGRMVDYDKFASAYTLLQKADNLFSVLGNAYMERTDKETVDKIIANPPSRNSGNVKPGTNKSDLETAIGMFSQMNNRNMK